MKRVYLVVCPSCVPERITRPIRNEQLARVVAASHLTQRGHVAVVVTR